MHIAETMRLAAVEVISIPCFQHAILAAHHDFDPSPQHDAAFFAIVLQHELTGISPRCLTFMQDLQFAVAQVPAYLAKGNRSFGQFQQLLRLEKNLILRRQVQAKKLA